MMPTGGVPVAKSTPHGSPVLGVSSPSFVPSVSSLAGAPVVGRPASVSAAGSSERALLAAASQMAQTYYNEGQWEMARRVLDSMAVSYRHEGWRSVLTTILLTALDCAMRLEDRIGSVNYSIELLGSTLLVTQQQKQQIMAQLCTLVFAPTPSVTSAPSAFADSVFEVDRRHELLQASSHFIIPATTGKDTTVCVGEEFDLVLSVTVGFPVATNFQRLDVYFYCPSVTGVVGVTQPYHLVLLPGGQPGPLYHLEGALSQPPLDDSLAILRPDSRGHVHADLTFPAATQPNGANTHIPSKTGHMAFTFGTNQHASGGAVKLSTRIYRIRMRATVATSPSTVLSLPSAAGASASAGVGVASAMAATAPQGIFPTSLVASMSVAPPIGSSLPPRTMQFRSDILPTRITNGGAIATDERIMPVSVLEAMAAERDARLKKAAKKGITLPPDSTDPTHIRTPTLRILPIHARARFDLLHPPFGLVGEFTPLRVSVVSSGDAIQGGLIELATTHTAGAAPPNSTNSQTNTQPPSPGGHITPSQSMDSIAVATTNTNTGVDAPSTANSSPGTIDPPSTLSRSNSNALLPLDPSESPVTLSLSSSVGVKVYRLAAGCEDAIGSSASPQFDELTTAIAVPDIPPNGSWATTIYIKAATPGTPTIGFTLTYAGAPSASSSSPPSSSKLVVTHSLHTLQWRAPFKIRTKFFSDALSGLGGATQTPTTAAIQRLILNAPTLGQIELENVSGVAIRIDSLALELSSKFFSTGVNGVGARPLRLCVSPAGRRALEDADHTLTRSGLTHAATNVKSIGAGQPPTVCLAPGEKYTHLVHFLPIVPGKTRYTPLQAKWSRITPFMEITTPANTPAATAAPPANSNFLSVTPTSSKESSSPSVGPTYFFFPTPLVHTRKDVTSFHILRAPLSVSFHSPASVVFGETFELAVRIANDTDQLHDVELHVLDVDGVASGASGSSPSHAAATHTGHASTIKLVFSGRTKGLIRIRPHQVETVTYRICPLECGAITLPRIQLKAAGLTTRVNATPVQATSASGAPLPSASSAPQQTIMLVDPNDVSGVVFVHPKPKQQSETPTAAIATTVRT